MKAVCYLEVTHANRIILHIFEHAYINRLYVDSIVDCDIDGTFDYDNIANYLLR